MQIPCVYLPGPAPAVSVANRYHILYILLYLFQQGTRHTSTVQYFHGASKTRVHEPTAIFGIHLFWKKYVANNCLQLLYFKPLSNIKLSLKITFLKQNILFAIFIHSAPGKMKKLCFICLPQSQNCNIKFFMFFNPCPMHE
jgi:hypothetical protein